MYQEFMRMLYLCVFLLLLSDVVSVKGMNLKRGEFSVVTDKFTVGEDGLLTTSSLIQFKAQQDAPPESELLASTEMKSPFTVRFNLPKFSSSESADGTEIVRFAVYQSGTGAPEVVPGCDANGLTLSPDQHVTGCSVYPRGQNVKYTIEVQSGARASALEGMTFSVQDIDSLDERELQLSKGGWMSKGQVMMFSTKASDSSTSFPSFTTKSTPMVLRMTKVSANVPEELLWSVEVGGREWPLCKLLLPSMPCLVRLQTEGEGIVMRYQRSEGMQVSALTLETSVDSVASIGKATTVMQIGTEQTLTSTQALYLTADPAGDAVGARGVFWKGLTSKVKVQSKKVDVDDPLEWSVLVDGVPKRECWKKKGVASCEVTLEKEALLSIQVHVEKGNSVTLKTGSQFVFQAVEKQTKNQDEQTPPPPPARRRPPPPPSPSPNPIDSGKDEQTPPPRPRRRPPPPPPAPAPAPSPIDSRAARIAPRVVRATQQAATRNPSQWPTALSAPPQYPSPTPPQSSRNSRPNSNNNLNNWGNNAFRGTNAEMPETTINGVTFGPLNSSGQPIWASWVE